VSCHVLALSFFILFYVLRIVHCTPLEEGGGTTNVPFFSSQEWTATVVDTNLQRLGKWGMTLHSFNFETQQPVSIYQYR